MKPSPEDLIRATDQDASKYTKYVKIAEETIKEFRFEPIDEISLGAVDALISKTYEEECEEMQRCKINTKQNDDGSVETYVLVHLKDNPLVFTFSCKRIF